MCLLAYFYIPALKSSAANLRAWARYFPIKYIFTSGFLSQFPFNGLVSVVPKELIDLPKVEMEQVFQAFAPRSDPQILSAWKSLTLEGMRGLWS